MDKAMAEVASTSCKDDCNKDNYFSNLLNKKNSIWIIVIIIGFCLCSGGGFNGGYLGNPCCKPNKGGGRGCSGGKGNGGGLILALLALAFLGTGGGLGSAGGGGGNVNTNVINVGPEDDCPNECCC